MLSEVVVSTKLLSIGDAVTTGLDVHLPTSQRHRGYKTAAMSVLRGLKEKVAGMADGALDTVGFVHKRLLWHAIVEVMLVVCFIKLYGGIRNQFGSQSGKHDLALEHALQVVSLEKSLGMFAEPTVQHFFLGSIRFIQFWNIYYGTLHSIISFAALIALFIQRPAAYQWLRTAFLIMNGVAFIGYAIYPLMPPRLLPDCTTPEGGCQAQFTFVDTMLVYGGFWSWQSKSVSKFSNQYAAMPSMHSGYSLWVASAVLELNVPAWVKVVGCLYPITTLFCIVVTANHYVMDFIMGGMVLLLALKLQSYIPRFGRGAAELLEIEQQEAMAVAPKSLDEYAEVAQDAGSTHV